MALEEYQHEPAETAAWEARKDQLPGVAPGPPVL